jgi:hypothetical protein
MIPQRLLKKEMCFEDEEEEVMKKVIVKCNQCGYEERIEIYTQEEAKKEQIRLMPPRCSKCGSPNVKMHD